MLSNISCDVVVSLLCIVFVAILCCAFVAEAPLSAIFMDSTLRAATSPRLFGGANQTHAFAPVSGKHYAKPIMLAWWSAVYNARVRWARCGGIYAITWHLLWARAASPWEVCAFAPF